MDKLGSQWAQRRVFLFSHPRTASNLLIRMLSGQSDWAISDYNFFDAFQYTRDTFDGISSSAELPRGVRAEYDTLVEQGHRKLNGFLTGVAKEKKHALIKDHALLTVPVNLAYWGSNEDTSSAPDYPREQLTTKTSNPTIFSKDDMLSWRPIILIRNPMVVYESWLRAEGKPYPDLESGYSKIYTSMKFQRWIFDWYHQCYIDGHSASPPIVLDADDIIESPETMRKLCTMLDMNEEELTFEWDAVSSSSGLGGINERYERYLKSFHCSTGVDRSKTSKDPVISRKEQEWSEEFGVGRAATLVRRVRDSWSDYERLKSFKLS